MTTNYTTNNAAILADAAVIRSRVFAGVPHAAELSAPVSAKPGTTVEVCRIAKRGEKFEEVVVASTDAANIASARAYAARGLYCSSITKDKDGNKVKHYKPARLYLRFKAEPQPEVEIAPVKPVSVDEFRKFWTAKMGIA